MEKERLLSLDVFRGITIAGMILVNDPGNWSYVYAPLLHSSWHGYTPTDLIFPFFIFIMGVAISLSKPKFGVERKLVMTKSIQRTFILFFIGLLLNGFPEYDFGSLRIPGVLQRIALVFMVCIWMHHNLQVKQQYITGSILLVGYWLIMSFVPVPGVGDANLEPGTNFAAWLDSIALTGHMWSSTKTWDPEGILSTFPAMVTGLMGLWTGKYLFNAENKTEALLRLMVFGVLAIISALIWSMHFPINKSLWTSSFVLVTGGWAMLLFSMLYWALDVLKKRVKVIYPFQVFGMNAITVYVFAGLLSNILSMIKIGDQSLHGVIYDLLVTVFGDQKLASLVFALLFVTFCYLPIWVMFKKRIFIKV